MDKNAIRNILTIMIVVFLGLPVSAEVLGTYTTNEYFYLPAYGEFGEEAFDEYNLYMEKADNQIEANKDDIESLQTAGFLTGITGESIGDLSDVDLTGIADNKILKYNATSQKLVVADDEDTTYSAGTGLSLIGTEFSSTITQYTDNLAISAIKNDNAWNASNWDTAYGWGDHSLEGYLTAETDPSFVDWSVSQTPTVIHADNYTDNDTTYTAGTGLDLTLTEFSLDATFADLSDIPAHPGVANKILETTAGGYIYIDTPSGGGGASELSDLSDVNTSTPTNRNVLVADGVDWESRALVEADISDLGTYLENVVEDTTPQLGGNLDATDKNITGIGRASFTQEYDNGSKSANFTIDFATDQKQKVTLTANTMTLTLDTTSVGVANYLLKIVNGGLATLTWAAETGSVYWPGGTEPTLTSSGTDVVTFYFDGTDWYCMAGLDFK